MSVQDVIDALERAPRQGAAEDEPEGARVAVISETALNRIVRELRLGSADRQDAEYFQKEHFNQSRSRDHGYPQPPPRIRTGGFPASGSCLR